MIRSITFPKSQSRALLLRCKDGAIEKMIQRRLFASASGIIDGGREGLDNKERNDLFKELLSVRTAIRSPCTFVRNETRRLNKKI